MLEAAFNERAWRRLNIQVIGPLTSLPQEFRLGAAMSDISQVKTDATATLAASPLLLPEDAETYLAGLRKADAQLLPFGTNNEITPSWLRYFRPHAYEERECHTRQPQPQTSPSGTAAIACLQDNLQACLPERTGKHALIGTIGTRLTEASAALGEMTVCRFSMSSGWMPSPARMKPHHDIHRGDSIRYRMLAVLNGPGPLVVPTSIFSDAERQMMLQFPSAEEDSNQDSCYPSFSRIARGNVYQLAQGYAGSWRTGHYETAAASCRPLPHAVPPYKPANGALRAIMVADFRS